MSVAVKIIKFIKARALNNRQFAKSIKKYLMLMQEIKQAFEERFNQFKSLENIFYFILYSYKIENLLNRLKIDVKLTLLKLSYHRTLENIYIDLYSPYICNKHISKHSK